MKQVRHMVRIGLLTTLLLLLALTTSVSTGTGQSEYAESNRRSIRSLSAPRAALLEPDTRRVSEGEDGEQGDDSSGGAFRSGDLSEDGRYAVFRSDADNLVGSFYAQILLKDTETGALERVSNNAAGEAADGLTFNPAISADGRYVVFASKASNLVPNDNNDEVDIFLRDRQQGTTIRISTAMDGAEADGRSAKPDITPDGRFIVFVSAATNLVADDTNMGRDIFVYDRDADEDGVFDEAGATSMARVNLTDEELEADSGSGYHRPGISDDGRYVVFDSRSNLTVSDTDYFQDDVYVRDRLEGDTELVTITNTGSEFEVQQPQYAISGDGRYVTFSTYGYVDVVRGWGGHPQVYVKDRETGSIDIASVSSSGEPANDAHETRHARRDPAISRDGRLVAFHAASDNLVPGDTNAAIDVFVHDMASGQTRRVSVSGDGVPGDDESTVPALNPDGRFVLFRSAATNLVADDTNGARDIFRRDQGDVAPPAVRDVQVDPNPANFNDEKTVTATVDDTDHGDATVVGAEYRLAGGDWQPLAAADGAFDSPTEMVEAVLPPEIEPGVYEVCVRASDEPGNRSRPTCAEFEVSSRSFPLTLTITRITDRSTTRFDTLSKPDFYAGVWLDITYYDMENPPYGGPDDHVRNEEEITPFWVYSQEAEDDRTPAIAIRIWDWDGDIPGPPDPADASPTAGRDYVLISVDPATGRWTGDAEWPQNCVEGDEAERAVEVCWDVSVWSPSGDADEDGFLDGWEENGYDRDADGIVDLDLPAWGASYDHRDLFLELDHVAGQLPGRDDIAAVKRAFAVAPFDNPDGNPGINLWIDTGGAVDPGAQEGVAPGTCMDGIDNGSDGLSDGNDPDCNFAAPRQGFLETSIEDPVPDCGDGLDNDGDGLADGDDPDCLIGDDLGGGNVVQRPVGCLDDAFYDTKDANFDEDRRLFFRYAISGHSGDNGSGDDSCGGGRGEIGGNDFVEYNHDGGTFMHELGHTLGLTHGGTDHHNCKPNYVSVMNYDYQFGIRRVGGGRMLDFEPRRIDLAGSSRGTVLPLLVEQWLDDGIVLDPADNANRYVFVDPGGQKVQAALNAPTNWNGDSDPPLETDQAINIDTSGANGSPSGCTNSTISTVPYMGQDNWANIIINYREFGETEAGARPLVSEAAPTLDELLALERELNTTDLSLDLVMTPDPAVAGQPLAATIFIANHGPNPASAVVVTATLPTSVTFAGARQCTASGMNVICGLEEIEAGETATRTLSLEVDGDLTTTVNLALSVANLLGPDADPADNSRQFDTDVLPAAGVRLYLPLMTTSQE